MKLRIITTTLVFAILTTVGSIGMLAGNGIGSRNHINAEGILLTENSSETAHNANSEVVIHPTGISSANIRDNIGKAQGSKIENTLNYSKLATQRSSTREQDLQAFIDSIAATEPLLSGQFGFLATKADGTVIASHEPFGKLVPASNTKLITTGMALHTLGPDYRFKTRLAYSGTVSDGTLDGDLWIIGGGDPTLASGDSIALSESELFSKMKGFMDDAGIRRVNGKTIGDGRHFNGPIEEGSWSYEDLGTYYGTGGNGLCYYRNVTEIKVSPGRTPGDSVKVEQAFPILPWMRYTNTTVTGRPGTGDKMLLYNTDMAPVADMRGTYAVDRKPKKEECSNKFGAYTLAHFFLKYLEDNGLHADEAADVSPLGNVRTIGNGQLVEHEKAVEPEKLTVIGEIESPEIGKIARIVNHRSDNFYADALFREVGMAKRGSAAWADCTLAEYEVLTQLGASPAKGIRMVDGSGLSRATYISPDFFCRFLRAMTGSPAYSAFLGSIGQPGKGGYAARLHGQPQELKERIRWKSGSMNGILCYSGYILPRESMTGSQPSRGESETPNPADAKTDSTAKDAGKPAQNPIVFSILTNNCSSSSQIQALIDQIVIRLARF